MICLFYLWCFDVKYVQFTFKLNPNNYCDIILNKIMQFFYIKHEHSCISFKNNISSIWIFKILNMYNIIHINHNTEFVQFLYEPIKLDKFVMKFLLAFLLPTCLHNKSHLATNTISFPSTSLHILHLTMCRLPFEPSHHKFTSFIGLFQICVKFVIS
jgi:hypothetical protein